jgi:hypothetical protein
VVDTNVVVDMVVASDGLVGVLDDMSMLVDLMVVDTNMLVDMLMLVDMSVGMLMVVDDMLMLVDLVVDMSMLIDLVVDMSMGVNVVVVIHCWFLEWYTSSRRLFQRQSWSRLKLESLSCCLVLQCPSVVVALNCRTLPSHHSQGSDTHW